MSTLYENYNTGDDDSKGFYGVYWKDQAFTPAVTHTITSVKLKLGRWATLTGVMTVSIRATSGGVPTGADLCSGTYDANSVPLTTPAFVEITLGAGTLLTAGVMYAIVYRYITGDATHYIFARGDGSSPAYAGGTYGSSANSGSTWGTEAWDAMFEEWGDPVVDNRNGTFTLSGKGNTAVTAKKGGKGALVLSGKGNTAFTGFKKALVSFLLSGKGTLTFLGKKAASGIFSLSGKGNTIFTGGQGDILSTDLWYIRFDQILSTDLWKITFTTIPVPPSSYALYKIVAITIKCGTAIVDKLKLRRIQ